ncbi:MAG: hypothetical protein ABIK92_09765 [Pseudomonadota bacterium]
MKTYIIAGLIISVFILTVSSANVVGSEQIKLPIVARGDIEYTSKGWLHIKTKALFTGVSVKHHQNGNVSGMVTIRNGVMDGPTVSFYETGQVFVHGMMQNNQKVGYWHYFFPSGVLHKSRLYEGTDYVYEARYDESGKLRKLKDFRKAKNVEQPDREATHGSSLPSASP